jgi:hypothetical protein
MACNVERLDGEARATAPATQEAARLDVEFDLAA